MTGRGERDAPLAGRRVVTTRDLPGRLDDLLAAAGADVVHVPLIEIGEPDDGGTALAAARADLDRYDWLVVTSRHGAVRVAGAAGSSRVATAAVGTSTASELSRAMGRPVDLVPERQLATALVDAFARVTSNEAPVRVLVAQADRAEPTLVDGLRALGHEVDAVVAYRTHLRRPTGTEIERMLGADAVAFASGSAARSWADAVGKVAPPVVCVIGPTTERVARECGLPVTAVANEHSVEGLVVCVIETLAR